MENTREEELSWSIWKDGKVIMLNILDYLNHLLEKSYKTIKNPDIMNMKFLIWNFKEIKDSEPSFTRFFQLQIDSEIEALERIIELKHIDQKEEIIIVSDR